MSKSDNLNLTQLSHQKPLQTTSTPQPNVDGGKSERGLEEPSRSRSSVPYPRKKTIVDLFEENAKNNPDAIAVVDGKRQYSFKTLNAKVNQLAFALKKSGVANESLVPVLISRSLESVIALLAIIKAGGAYVPLDPTYPETRIRYMLNDTQARILVYSGEASKSLPKDLGIATIDVTDETLANLPEDNLVYRPLPQQLAYVIYTSGSSGKPKGVMIEHRALLDHCYGIIEAAGLSNCRSFALMSPLVFDAGHSLLHSALILGAGLHVISENAVKNGKELAHYLKEKDIDFLKVVPSLWLSYLQDGPLPLAKKVMLFGGEPFPMAIHEILGKEKYLGRVYNHYGPTEATIGKCIYRVNLSKTYKKIPIGRPFSNTKLYVVGDDMRLASDGKAGELLIAGDGLARGYLNLDELTRDRFIPNPFGQPGEKCYRTGDLVQWSADDQLEYLGRSDDQMKVRGYRIEPGEIEKVLELQPTVRQALVTAYTSSTGQESIVAYIVPNGELNASKLAEDLRTSLPDYMIPGLWVGMDKFPLTINGKVDKKALPDPAKPQGTTELPVAPRSPDERKLLQIWEKLSGVSGLGIRKNFFEMGGNSLLVMRFTATISREWQKDLSIKDVFSHPTIEALASTLSSKNNAPVHRLEKNQNPTENLPLSHGQEGLWFLHQLEGSEAYHLSLVFQIEGDLQEPVLERALRNLLKRHQVLSTRILTDEEGLAIQVPFDPAGWRMAKVREGARYSGFSDPGLEEEIVRIIQKPFNFPTESLFRASLIQIAADKQVLVLAMHHMVSDGWSMSIIKNELSTRYREYLEKSDSRLPALPIQYSDYAYWQRAHVTRKALKKSLDYWKDKLGGVSPLQLPTDFTRSQATNREGKTLRFKLENNLFPAVEQLARKNGATLYMTLLATFKVLMYRYSQQNDICVGTAISGREEEKLQSLVGYFVRTLPIRSTVEGKNTFSQVLQEVKKNSLELFDHQETPFEKLVESVGVPRIQGMHPLFQHMFVYQDATSASLQLDGCEVREMRPDHRTATFDLTFELRQQEGGLEGKVEYDTSLYTEQTIERLMGHYLQLLKEFSHSQETPIDRVQLTSPAEKKQLLMQFGCSAAKEKGSETSVASVLDLIAQQIACKPDATALEFGNESITYQMLGERSEQMACYLRRKGVKVGDKVILCLPRSTEMIISLLGILKAGAAYVPIDPEYPEARIRLLSNTVHPSLTICQSATQPYFQNTRSLLLTDRDMDDVWAEPAGASPLHLHPELPAYIIFTSGSTGSPKGVSVSHRALAVSTQTRVAFYPEVSTSLLIPSFAFDSSVAVIFGTLAVGGNLILCPSNDLYRPEKLLQHLNKTENLLCVPSFYRFLLEENLLENAPLKWVTVAGESLDDSLVNLHFSRLDQTDLYNEYGPTEATVWASVEKIEKNKRPVTIGGPNAHTSIYILDQQGTPVPIGMRGELYIGGEGVAQGYFDQPLVTSSKFLPDPFSNISGARMYRTGDLAKWLPDGRIAFLGRRDQQVKINGFRIELEEIESTLNGLSSVKVAAVTLGSASNGTPHIIAHVVPGNDLDRFSFREKKGKLISDLETIIPRYMIPANWAFLPELPLTANKKIDRKKLAESTLPAVPSEEKLPTDPIEESLSEIWKKILNLDAVSTTADFFMLGGHSILGIKLVAAVRRQMHKAIGLGDLFSAPTIEGMAEIIRKKGLQPTLPPIVAGKGRQQPHAPLSFSQESLWFIDLLEGSDQYHIPIVLRLNGALDRDALEKALKRILTRHEVLRTVVLQHEGKPYQEVIEPENWQMEQSELVYSEDLNAQVQTLLAAPFDLSNHYMLRAHLISINPSEAVLVMTLHHIAFDGWSLPLFMKELNLFYRAETKGETLELPSPLQYRDFALWQRKNLSDNYFQSGLKYWKSKLAGLKPLLQREGTDNGGVESSFIIPKPLKKQLEQLSARQGATLYMTLLAVFKVWLHQFFAREDLCVGTATSGRQHPELERALGYFINPLPLRTSVSDESTFSELLAQVKATCTEAFENQEVPFDRIVTASGTERVFGQNPLFQVMCTLQDTAPIAPQWGEDLDVTAVDSRQVKAKYDLSLIFTPTDKGLEGKISYKSRIFNESTALRLAEEYRDLLEKVFEDPNRSIGSMELRTNAPILPETIPGPVDLPDFTPVHQLIRQAAARNPGKIAVRCKDRSLSYRDLDQSANQLAHFLIQKGMGPGKVVGMLMDRSVEMIISILGILKTGAAYLPIDISLPEKRILHMVQDSCETAIAREDYPAGKDLVGRLLRWETFISRKNELSSHAPEGQSAAQDPAYIIYTSGSTGKPKGVVISHGNLHNFLMAVSDAPGICSEDRFLAVSSVSFDIAILETLLPYAYGAQCCILDESQRKDPRQILEALDEFHINTVFATPTHWKMLLEIGWDKRFENLRIISGGEALPLELARQLLARSKSVWNIYGPTETTVFSTIKAIEASDNHISIGKPIRNTAIYILDENGRPVQPGQEGELYISGAGVAKGYLNQPGLSKERFLQDPFHPSGKLTMYRTGDLGKSLEGGAFALLGRIDQQVKIRGHRIELGEIEQALREQVHLKNVAVIYWKPETGNAKLLAFIKSTVSMDWQPVLGFNVAAVSSALSRSWNGQLGQQLPDYMIPDSYGYLQDFPMTSSGKLDRRKLEAIAAKGFAEKRLSKGHRADLEIPNHPMDSAIARTWQKVLDLPQVKLSDHFFEIGGHSLAAVQVMAELESSFGIKLPLALFFKYPILKDLAGAMQSQVDRQRHWESLVPIQPEGTKAPLFVVHGAGLHVRPFYDLAKRMDPDQPVFGLQAKGLDGEEKPLDRIEAMASHYIAEIERQFPEGPYLLAGYSLGGIIAFEMAKQWKESGKKVQALILIDTFVFPKTIDRTLFDRVTSGFRDAWFDWKLLFKHPRILFDKKKSSWERKKGYLKGLLRKPVKTLSPLEQTLQDFKQVHREAMYRYQPTYLDRDVYLLRAKTPTKYFYDPRSLGWKPLVKRLIIREVEGTHPELFSPKHIQQVAATIQDIADRSLED